MKIPIVLFVYNRPEHTKKTLSALQKNTEAADSNLFIFSDGAKNSSDHDKVEKVRAIVSEIKGFKSVNCRFSDKNKGLANSIITGLSSLFEKYEKLIVLEDDLITSPYFLDYMNAALNFYSHENVWSVTGYTAVKKIPINYNYHSYLSYRSGSWGWGTWRENWEKVDWTMNYFNDFITDKQQIKDFQFSGLDLPVMLLKQKIKQLDSWAIRFTFAGFQNKLPSVYPAESFVDNIGMDASGTHFNSKISKTYKTTLIDHRIEDYTFCPSDCFNKSILDQFRDIYTPYPHRQLLNKRKINKYIKSLKSEN